MHTFCPTCKHSQQISRKRLKKIRGLVNCSQCKQQYNAYLTLSKNPPQTTAPKIQPSEKLASETDKSDIQIPEITALIKPQNQTTKETETIDQPVDDTPIEIYAWQKPKSAYRPDRWLVGSILGLLLLTYQVHYFKGYSLSQNPQLRPWLTSISSLINYPLPDYRKPLEFTTIGSSFKLSSNDHYRLQVSFINHADFRQPLPYLQLTLQNFYGGVFAQRLFSPQEYLGKTTIPQFIKRSDTLNIDFLIAKPKQEVGGYTIELK